MDPNPWDVVLADQDAHPASTQRRALAGVVVVLVGVIVVTSGAVISLSHVAEPTEYPVVPVTLAVNGSSVVAVLPSGFYGVNAGPVDPLDPAASTLLNATPVSEIVWPGGATADALDLPNGTITYDSGATTPAAENESGFVAWCVARGCHAVLQVPGEIDDPAMGAYLVRYTESTLGFTPDYWEIGDEPARWSHFGIPWAQWNTSQRTNATPVEYADLVHAYLAAMRAVDPSVRVLGLPGVGTGTYGETTWIAATVRENGANLSGVGIHVYPAGSPPTGPATVQQFYGNFTSTRAVGARIPADRATVDVTCPTCQVPVLITEFGTGIEGGSFDPYIGGFAEVPYVATELVQAMELNVSQADLFQFQSPRGGAWEDDGGAVHPLYALYTTILPQLGRSVVAANVGSQVPGFSAIVTVDPSGWSLLAVNGNLSIGVALNVPAAGLSVGGSVTAWTWTGGSDPTVGGWSGTNLTVPPESLVLLHGTSSVGPVTPGLAAPTSPSRGPVGPSFVPLAATLRRGD